MRTSSVVGKVLKYSLEARNSDKKLIALVFEEYGLTLTPEQMSLLMRLPTPETITRVRRKFQEKGLYPATSSVRRERRIKSMVVQQVSPKDTPQQLENHMGHWEGTKWVEPTQDIKVTDIPEQVSLI